MAPQGYLPVHDETEEGSPLPVWLQNDGAAPQHVYGAIESYNKVPFHQPQEPEQFIRRLREHATTQLPSPSVLSKTKVRGTAAARDAMVLVDLPPNRRGRGQGLRKDASSSTACMAYSAHKHQIVLGSVDKKLTFFQVAFRKYTFGGRVSLPNPPRALCCEHWAVTHKDLLVVGDSVGRVTVYDHGDWCPAPRELSWANLHFDLSDPSRQRGASVTRMALWPNIGLVSGGMDGRLIISKDIENLQSTQKVLTGGHDRGIFALAHSTVHRCFVSAGYDRKVLVWDPFLPKPVGFLPEQSGDIMDLVINGSHNQIITIFADKKIKVFDIRTHTEICSLVDTAEYSFQNESFTAAAFDEENQRLVTACNKLRFWHVSKSDNKPIGSTVSIGLKESVQPVVAVLYSATFHELVTVHADEMIRVWNFFTGRLVVFLFM
jgi:WD40 repeat protein